MQAVDPIPEPGGTMRVVLDVHGRPAGVYVVVPKAEQAAADGQLHQVHRATCGNATGRRVMARRDTGHDDSGAERPGRVVPCGEPRCPYPLDEVLLVAGHRYHPTCDPAVRHLMRDHPFWSEEGSR